MQNEEMKPCLYIFLDESGNFDFSSKGSKYYIFTAITKERPFLLNPLLEELKYDLLEFGLEVEYFHASEDRKPIRSRVYSILADNHERLNIYSVIIEKSKVDPELQDPVKFYPIMLGYLVRHVIKSIDLTKYKEVIVITDSLPNNKHGQTLNKAIKPVLNSMIRNIAPYRIMHHSSKSCLSLQVVDYCCYAMFRKYESNDLSYYDLIKGRLCSENVLAFSTFQ